MEPIIILILHFFLYSIPIFFFVKFIKEDKLAIFYAFFGFLFVFTQLFAVLYSIKVASNLVITGGNIAYSSLIFIALIIMILTQEPKFIRTLIIIQIILNVFLFFLYELLNFVLNLPSTINILGVPPSFFSTTLIINVASSLSFVAEILTMFFVLEKLKVKIRSEWLKMALHIGVYVGILCLDGFLFPFIVMFFIPSFGELLVGSMYGKFVIGLGFAPFFLAFLVLNRVSLEKYAESRITLKELILPSRADLMLRLKVTKKKLVESVGNYKEAYKQVKFYKDLFIHDIGNVIHSIGGSVQLLEKMMQKGDVPDNINQVFNILNQSSGKGREIIKKVKKLSLIEANEGLPLVKTSILVLLEKAISYIKKSMKEEDIQIVIRSSEEDLYCTANELLSDVFENLINNAIKYNNDQDKELIIKISRHQEYQVDYIKMQFIDNGSGVSDDVKSVIFKRGFEHLKGGKGMGFGLSIISEIVHQYNGKIWVEDRVDNEKVVGSKFILLLPEH